MTDIRVDVGEWRAVWSGGRLADIFHSSDGYESAVECVQVGEYSFAWTRDELEQHRGHLGADDVHAALVEWLEQDGETYMANVVAYR
jgi:hypothetical protein